MTTQQIRGDQHRHEQSSRRSEDESILSGLATIAEVSKEVKRAPRTIRRWMQAGLLAYVQVGNQTLIDRQRSRELIFSRIRESERRRRKR
jgi:hypothetical protein